MSFMERLSRKQKQELERYLSKREFERRSLAKRNSSFSTKFWNWVRGMFKKIIFILILALGFAPQAISESINSFFEAKYNIFNN